MPGCSPGANLWAASRRILDWFAVPRAGRCHVTDRHCASANDCLDIGTCLGTPVSLDYRDRAPFPFEGRIHRVHVAYT